MKQVYYTQCPLGYGLGATNGFQVKRLDEGYPTGVDFRHLGMRAFLPGSRVLAPASLRYRRDGEVAEVAWLTPRTHEYETEEGRQWGRPGGQFAHGLRLDESELEELSSWPAGLFNAGFWRRSDPERTAGRPPEAINLSLGDLICRPTFEEVTKQLAGDLNAERLAWLLAGVARATAEARCLFLVAERERLGPLIALLTFCFPVPLRAELSFSTYHDRPEELAGFRIQGTVAEARPNRMVLNSQGIVADLGAGNAIKRAEPAPYWARTLAAWVIQPGASEVSAWSRVGQRLRRMKRPPDVSQRWSEEWLDQLFWFENLTQENAKIPESRREWSREMGLAKWSVRSGLVGEWLKARGPQWWRQVGLGEVAERELARESLIFTSRLSLEAQGTRGGNNAKVGSPSEWGQVVAAWHGQANAEEVASTTADLLGATPRELRGAFLASMVQGLPIRLGDEVVATLGHSTIFEPELLLPIEASRLAVLVEAEETETRLREVFQEVMARPGAVVSTLEAAAEAVAGREADAAKIAEILAEAFEADEDQPGWQAAWTWGLSRKDAPRWLGPYMRRLAMDRGDPTRWRSLLEKTAEPFRGRFTWAWLESLVEHQPAFGSGLAWCVEEVLIPMGRAGGRPQPTWAEAYVRSRSGLELARRLYRRQSRDRATGRWLSDAHQRGELGAGSIERLKASRLYAETLELQKVEALPELVLPDARLDQRGSLLDEMIGAFGGDLETGLLPCLEVCQRNWKSAAFAAGAEGLAGIASSLANALQDRAKRPSEWLNAAVAVIDHLSFDERERVEALGPEGLLAHVARSSLESEGLDLTEQEQRRLRNALFRDAGAWKALGLEVSRWLDGSRKQELRSALEFWDHELVRGSDELEHRFAELVLNSATTAMAILTAVEYLANHLSRMEPVACWSLLSGGADFREWFATQAPLTPLDAATLPAIRRWMKKSAEAVVSDFELSDLEILPEDRLGGVAGKAPTQRPDWLSDRAWTRWKCLEALTILGRAGLGEFDRWNTIGSWSREGLSLKGLEDEDRYGFLARVIQLIEEYSAGDLKQQRLLQDLARWLVGQGFVNHARVKGWTRDLQGEAEADRLAIERKELARDLSREIAEELERG